MERYIKWLSVQLGGRFAYLLWDRGVKRKAHKRNVNLSFIPAGQTGTWQPLDRRVYGAVKCEAMERLNEICMDEDLASLDIVDALSILMDVWNELPVEDVKKSWDHLFMADDLPPEDGSEDADEDSVGLASSGSSDEEEDGPEFEEEEDEAEFVEEYFETPIATEEEEEEDEVSE